MRRFDPFPVSQTYHVFWMLTYVVSETLPLAARLEYGIHSVIRGCSLMLHFHVNIIRLHQS